MVSIGNASGKRITTVDEPPLRHHRSNCCYQIHDWQIVPLECALKRSGFGVPDLDLCVTRSAADPPGQEDEQIQMLPKILVKSSLTRFGEISPLMQKFNKLLAIP